MAEQSLAGMKRRLSLNLFAGVGSQFASLFQQIVSVPVLLYAWKSEAYGVWITLYSVEVYLQTFASFGFANVAASEIGMRRSAGDAEGSLAILQSVLRFTGVLSVLVVLAGLAVAFLLPLGSWLGIPEQYWQTSAWVFAILVIGEPITILGAVVCAVYRGEGRMAQGVLYYYVIARILEAASFMLAAGLGGGLIAAAVAALATRLVVISITMVLLRRDVPWVRYGFRYGSWATVWKLIRPAAAHMALPASMVMNVAGVNVVVSILLGPTAVTTVSVIRTIGNLAFQAFNMLVQAMWPELSRMIGAGELGLARSLIARAGRYCLWLCALFSLGLLAFAPIILKLWTGGKVPLVWGLLASQLAAIMLSCLWRVPTVTLLAANRNARMGVVVVAASFVNVAVVIALLPVWGLSAVGMAMVVAEAMVLLLATPEALSLVGMTSREYARGLLVLPGKDELASLLTRPLRAFRQGRQDPH